MKMGSAFWEEVRASSKPVRSPLPHSSALLLHERYSFLHSTFQYGVQLLTGKCPHIPHLKQGYPSPGSTKLP